MKRRSSSAVVDATLVLLLALFAATAAAGQSPDTRSTDGAISGDVRDVSGAVVPRPTIVIRHERSGLEQIAVAANRARSRARVASTTADDERRFMTDLPR
jgi:hypothetical protein